MMGRLARLPPKPVEVFRGSSRRTSGACVFSLIVSCLCVVYHVAAAGVVRHCSNVAAVLINLADFSTI